MKILVVTQYFWPENFRINDWVDGMVERGHEVTVLTSLPNYPKGILFDEYKKDPSIFNRYKNVEVIRVPQILRGNKSIQLALNYISFAFFGSTIGLWKLRNKEFDVSFVFGVSPILVVIPALIYKLITKTKVALWVLDLWPESLRAVGIVTNQRLISVVRYFVKMLYSKVDLILGQSNAFVDSIIRTKGNNISVFHLPNWSDISVINKNETILSAPELKRTPNDFVVLFSGNVGEAQDFDTIIRAANLLKDKKNIKFKILGEGRCKEKYVQLVSSLALEDTVDFLGSYPIDRMNSFYLHADVFLVTLVDDDDLSKTIPGKVHSYLSFGKPLIAAINGETAQLIKISNCGSVVNSGDFIGLANEIEKFSLMNKSELKILADNAKIYYEKNFDRKKVLDTANFFLCRLTQNLVIR